MKSVQKYRQDAGTSNYVDMKQFHAILGVSLHLRVSIQPGTCTQTFKKRVPPIPKCKEKNIPKLRKELRWFDGADSDGFVSEDGLQMPRNTKLY